MPLHDGRDVRAAREQLELFEPAQRIAREAPPIERGVHAGEGVRKARDERAIEEMLERLGHSGQSS